MIIWNKNRKIKKPLGPISFIKKEHKKGADIALIPNISCKPAPADTNFSFGKKSFTYARFRENKGRHIPAYKLINI